MTKSKSSKVYFCMKLSSVLFISVIVGLGFVYRDRLTLEKLVEFTPENMVLIVGYVLICYGVKSVSIIFPIAVLFLLSGRLFLPFEAILVNIGGMVIALSIPYGIGRLLGVEMYKFIEDKYCAVKKLSHFSNKNQLFFSYIVRAINLLPGDIVSLLLGSCGFGYKKYLIGSLVGMLPTMVAVTIMGRNITRPTSLNFLISMGVTLIFSVLPLVVFILKEKKKS